jgi:uncharacterized membrane protein YhaH (DUF805 family)
VFDAFKKYAVFRGRANRKEFWLFQLLVLLVVFPGSIAVAIMSLLIPFLSASWFMFLLTCIVPYLAVSVRRLHDTGSSGAWILVMFIPIIGFFWFYAFMLAKGQAGENRYGPPPYEIRRVPAYNTFHPTAPAALPNDCPYNCPYNCRHTAPTASTQHLHK